MLPLLIVKEACVKSAVLSMRSAKSCRMMALMISANVVQSPVFYGHAQMVSFEAQRPLAAEEARDAFSLAKISNCPKRRVPDAGRRCFR
jgi:aspartate-semialdehyde dehydrogenase